MQTYSNLTSDEILKIQADVLTGDISNNSSYMKASTIASKNYQFNDKLGISKKKVIPVINDLAKTIEEANTLTANALTDMYNVLGNIGAYPKLKTVIKNTTVKTDMSADLGYPTDEETPRPEVSIAEIVLDLVKRTEDVEKSGSNTIRNINTISNNISTLRTDINKKIKSIEEQIAYCNSTVLFRDKFYVTNNTTTQFNLTHLPIEESITFWINGVCYFDDVYTYDKDTNTVNYTENANLNLENCYVVIEYKYNKVNEDNLNFEEDTPVIINPRTSNNTTINTESLVQPKYKVEVVELIKEDATPIVLTNPVTI